MDKKYSSLFEPLKIANLEIKNRIGMAPMAASGLINSDNAFDQRAIEYYVERAKGGAGLIITGGVEVENTIEQTHTGIFQNISTNPTAFKLTAVEMVERVQAHGAKIFLQLTMGFGRSLFLDVVDSHPAAPSAVSHFSQPEITCRELKTEEVEFMIQKMIDAAVLAEDIGFDGVEVHAMHEGYLIDQFALSLFNNRTDKYGGNLKNRLRVAAEIVQGIKKKLGSDYPVTLRYGVKSCIKELHQGGLPGEDYQEKGRTLEEGLEVAAILEEAGYDALNADLGSYEALYWAHPPTYMDHGPYLPYVQKLKEVVDIPILTAGRLDDPKLAAQAVGEGQVDMALLGRGLLADPDWPNKVRYQKLDKIRPCLGCHDGCMGRMESGKKISCAVNPACGREVEYSIDSALKEKEIMIVGGGIAAMEAARVCALRGHKVKLYEKNDYLGGHLIEASVPEFKKDERKLIEWYKNELAELEVNINLEQEVDQKLIEELSPDEVIIAAGAKANIPPIAGVEQKNVITACRALMNEDQIGEKVVILGGGLVGVETAVWLAEKGKEITIVEMMDDLLDSIFVSHANSDMLKDLVDFHKIDVKTGSSILEIDKNTVSVISKNFRRENIEADTIIIAAGYKENKKLYRQIKDMDLKVNLIGDSKKVANIMYSIWDAYEVAKSI
ncbi:2-enoate reductase [Halanaerobium congolense]|jgi:2-enoate reductase|uniref:2-enoate reductase n=1 Tax=Halanaerobium congolense TaxID=54121 RepID=A0A1G8RHN4_9FIRM|nr:FAD-dependent oxidoreductase [Halanaerobium congolense]PUU91046.1 MAG: 2-enoate reductase [Halanaerobium sp.]SDJ16373.1 2-enoate reductase [Halanaerobium congolense]SET72600.1 2-enoate reductase [Halanaerobium congolense]